MKKNLLIMAGLVAACSLGACKDDKDEDCKVNGTCADSKTDDDAKSDSDSKSDDDSKSDAGSDDWDAYCAKTTGENVSCADDKSGNSLIIQCKDKQLLNTYKCWEHSSCAMVEGQGYTCVCDEGWDITASDELGYYCKEQIQFPADIVNKCDGKADGFTACVESGEDIWAIYCYQNKIYSGNSDNCTAQGLKCGDVYYPGDASGNGAGNYKECVDCAKDSDCVIDGAPAHVVGKCNSVGKCERACEKGWEDPTSIFSTDAECSQKIELTCETEMDCPPPEENEPGKYVLCGSSKKCDYYCQEDYDYVWDQTDLLGDLSCKAEEKN